MSYEFVVVGGGILGLAVAARLSDVRPGATIALIEKEPTLAAHQTGRNSGVIHAGIYYKPGSLKARTCLVGRKALIEFARTHGVAHDICGKLIVATHVDQEPRLRALFERGLGHGLHVSWLDPNEARAFEPHVACHAAIRVPETGIIDYTQVCRRLAECAGSNGVELRLGEEVLDVHRSRGLHVVDTSAGRLDARFLITCGGLYSDRLARMDAGDPKVQTIPFRGEYFELVPERRELVQDLIYPVPDPAFPFLGVHFTRMIDGGVHAGPNAVLACRREGYRKRDVHIGELGEILAYPGFWRLAAQHWRSGAQEVLRSLSKARFTESLRALIPDVASDDLVPASAGVRAQAVGRDGTLLDDFLVVKRPGALHVLNAPSPAATASLAIADTIVRTVPRC